MRWSKSTIVYAVMLGAALLACKQAQQLKEKAEKQAKEAAEEATNPDQQLGAKLDSYLPCINQVSGRVMDSRQRYASWLDDVEQGPTGKERVVYNLYPLVDSTLEQCKQGLTAAREKKPDLADLDKAGKDYEAALTKVAPLIKDAHDYYDQKKYLDDKFAKAKEMHKPLWSAFTAFAKANDALHSAYEAQADGLAERELKRIEKDEGKKLHYWTRKLMLDAKALVRAADVKDLDELDAAKFGAQVDAFEAVVKSTDDYATGHAAEKKTTYSRFISSAKDFLKSCRALHRRVRDKTPWSFSDKHSMSNGMAEHIEGHPANVLKTYNDLVSASNMMNRF